MQKRGEHKKDVLLEWNARVNVARGEIGESVRVGLCVEGVGAAFRLASVWR